MGGSIADGWEDLRSAFEANFADNLELGAQLVVYKEGVPVADLHGHAPAQPGYNAQTMQNVFSSGKNLEAIACSAHSPPPLRAGCARASSAEPLPHRLQ